jgi:hypothetical protein
VKNVVSGGLNSIAYNVLTLGEEADLEAESFSLAQMPIESTNVQFSTKPAFLPNVCYKPFIINNLN